MTPKIKVSYFLSQEEKKDENDFEQRRKNLDKRRGNISLIR